MKSFKRIFYVVFIATLVILSCLLPNHTYAQTTGAIASTNQMFVPAEIALVETSEPQAASKKLESTEASYPGGAQELETFLQTHVEYPELARDNNFEGTTVIRFKVMQDGSLGQFTVAQSTHPICDEAVIKALQKMTPWTPAKMLGKEAATWRAVSVDFKLTF